MARTDAVGPGLRGNNPQGTETTSWPDWPLDRGEAGQLARYVSETHAGRWIPTDLRAGLLPGATVEQRRDRAERLYKALALRRIPYASVPWNPAGYDLAGKPAKQRVRTPLETIEGPATCLDLVLTFAGMAFAADLRPLIAIRYQAEPHALLVLDLTGGPTKLTPDARVPGFQARPGELGVWDGDAAVTGPLGILAETPGWLPVDVVRVTQDGVAFGAASGRRPTENVDLPGAAWTLVDVRQVLARLSAQGLASYEPPVGRSAPPIHGYLPAFPEFRDFPSRQLKLQYLENLLQRDDPATIVIQAPSGYGKSMLAHRLAVSADNGCGWFLNATDAKELRRSLAQAERSEHELAGERPRPGGEKADAVDDQAFAAAALDRLRTTDRPWVVVVDNCDSAADTQGLADLLPRPHAARQVVIITTTHRSWLDYASAADHRLELTGLGAADLQGDGDNTGLGLPRGIWPAIAGRPLIALALAALRDHGHVQLPAESTLDGPELVWDLLRTSSAGGPEVLELARLLAWLPPEPTPDQELAKIATGDASPGDTLARLRFVTRTTTPAPRTDEDGKADHQGTRDQPFPEGARSSPGMLMHRLFAAAVREQTWRDSPDVAADSITRLLTSERGRWLFIVAADDTALSRLERSDTPERSGAGDVERAAAWISEQPRPGRLPGGLLWHGLGHIRERRGPVKDSSAPFAMAGDLLDPAQYPYQVAESLIGVARVASQNGGSTDPELESARERIGRARELLLPSLDPDARQLREQGNALSWLIERRLTGHEPDLDLRESRYMEVYRNLWLSFAQRLRIAHGLADETPVAATAVPMLNDGLGPERAFFNLAGTAVDLAKAHHAIAERAAALTGRPLKADDALLTRTATDLGNAERVYQAVRELRELRYGGRPHPHLAACLYGLALVGHYRAALLDQLGEVASAAAHGAAALDQRMRIAGSLAGPSARAVLKDGDVRKSADLMLKVMADSVLARDADPAKGAIAVDKVISEATSEWQGGPGRTGNDATADKTPEPLTTRDPAQGREPNDSDFFQTSTATARPRYLAVTYPDVVRPRRRFSLDAEITLSSSVGRHSELLHGLDIPTAGKALVLSIYARGLTVLGDHNYRVHVPAEADSEPVRFDLEGTVPGIHEVTVRAWDGGTRVGEVTVEVTVDEYAHSAGDLRRDDAIEATPLVGEITLEVTQQQIGGQNRYGFRFRDRYVTYSEEFRPLRHDAAVDVETLTQRIRAIAEGALDLSLRQMHRALRQEGQQLWDGLIPLEVQRQFWDSRDRISQFTILSDNDAFPWEILHPGDDGVDFLAAQDFPVTRTLKGWRPEPRLYRRPARFVVPGGGAETPPLAQQEVKILKQLLDASDPVISGLSDLEALLDAGGFGVLHFACHGSFSQADQGPQIDLDQPLLTRQLARPYKTWERPLVFLNACRSATPRYRCYGIDGFAERFLRAGAGAFIGSLWEVGDGTALRFSTELYKMLASGKTLGEAVQPLRKRVKNGDPTWLAYAVYGHPEARLV